MKHALIALGVACTPLAVGPQERPVEDLAGSVAAHYDGHLRALFEHLHANPELSFVEFETSKRLAAELRATGAEVTEGVGGTGVVGMLRNGEGPLVLVRADMDGLPIAEETGLPYASEAVFTTEAGTALPVMHACGHDVHMTVLVGTAHQLARRKDAWSGTVMLVGQPAEERIGGARAMLRDRLYERFGVPDAALAIHVSAGKPAGKIMLSDGLLASSSDSVDIVVRGIGAHGASPHKGKDPIYIGAQIVVALQGLVSRELSPQEPGVVTVGSFHGGTKHNIIPEEARLQLTVRSDSEATRKTLLDGIVRIAENIGRANGLPEDLLPTVELSTEATPTTVNDPKLAGRVRAAIVRGMGEGAMHPFLREGMGAEDFAYFVRTKESVPGAYLQVGGTAQADLDAARAGGPPVPSHHSPIFRIEPEPSVKKGVEAMTLAVMDLLTPPD
ncbi:MAG: amidohydrolase [Planctomycetota bacterium]